MALEAQISSVVRSSVNPALHHAVVSDAPLQTLGFRDELDLVGLQCNVEEELGIEFNEYEHAKWQTVSDVIRSAAHYAAREFAAA